MWRSINGIKLEIWARWLFYAVLVDLGDSVADELSLPYSVALSSRRTQGRQKTNYLRKDNYQS